MTNTKNNPDDEYQSPIILVGMHRAGTTLVTSLLKEIGLYTGKNLDSNEEPWLVIALNNWMLRKSASCWDRPLGFNRVLDHEEVVEPIADHVRAIFQSLIGKLFFFGRHRMVRTEAGPGLTKHWGFKDPRNSITLPIWHRLYPDCRVVVISRHGVDVARSLVTREQYGHRLAAHMRVAKKLLYRLRFTIGRVGGLSPAARMDTAFHLWESYMGQVERSLAHCGENVPVHRVCYEDLLKDPKNIVEELVRFCGLDHDEDTINRAISRINETRRFSFLNYPESVTFAQENRDVLLKFGYDETGVATDGSVVTEYSAKNSSSVVKDTITNATPFVSVIVEIDSSETGAIKQTLHSVYAQTWQNLEIIVVDSRGVSATDELSDYAQLADSRTRLIEADSTQDHCATRNQILEDCKGEFIGFICAGTVWHPEKIARQVHAFQHSPKQSKIAVVTCKSTIFAAEESFATPVGSVSQSGDVFSRLLERNIVPVFSAALFRASSIRSTDGFDATTEHQLSQRSAEYWLLLQISANNHFMYVNDSLVAVKDTNGAQQSDPLSAPALSLLPIKSNEDSSEEFLRKFREKFSDVDEKLLRLGLNRRYLFSVFDSKNKRDLRQRFTALGQLFNSDRLFWLRGHTISSIKEFLKFNRTASLSSHPEWVDKIKEEPTTSGV